MAAMLVFAMRVGRPGAAPGDTPERAQWNFLIVVVDTLRYDVTSMAGQRNTPFLQRVAQRGVSFSRAFSPHDNTPQSHFTLLTGLREGSGTAVDRPDVSIAYQLRAHGYDTFGVAANGNLSQRFMPSLGGFRLYSSLYDEWLGLTPQDRAPQLQRINARLRQYGSRENDWNQAQMFCSGPAVLDRFRKMLSSTSRPFFGFINIIEPHDPYLPSAGSLGNEPDWVRTIDADLRFRVLGYPLADPERYPDSAGRAYIRQRREQAGGRLWSLSDDLSQQQLAAYKRRYEASARDADQVVRAIFLELERVGLLDTTWVIVVSDHGESFGEEGFLTHSLSDKGSAEATRHVPMIWAAPLGGTGLTVDEDVSLTGVAPTIYALAGIDWTVLKAQAQGEFGRSLLPYLAVDAEHRIGTALTGESLSTGERRRIQKDALERLRTLGYVQ